MVSFCFGFIGQVSGRVRHVNQSQVFRCGLPGEEPPQIHRQLPRHRYDRLLARSCTSLGIAQHRHPLAKGMILRLPADHAPYHLHKHRSHPWVAALVDASTPSLAPAAVLPWAKACITRHFATIVEARPVTNLSAQYLETQRPDSLQPPFSPIRSGPKAASKPSR